MIAAAINIPPPNIAAVPKAYSFHHVTNDVHKPEKEYPIFFQKDALARSSYCLYSFNLESGTAVY